MVIVSFLWMDPSMVVFLWDLVAIEYLVTAYISSLHFKIWLLPW